MVGVAEGAEKARFFEDSRGDAVVDALLEARVNSVRLIFGNLSCGLLFESRLKEKPAARMTRERVSSLFEAESKFLLFCF